MYWKKIGQIFNPTEHTLYNQCNLFAQSPQTIVFNNFVRVYFSTRRIDEKNNKYFSEIAFVDYTLDFTKILKVSSNKVINLGDLGDFDEHGIFPISPYKEGDKILAYTCGWSRRKSVSVETATGLAQSFDNGETFTKPFKGPVLSASLNEPMLVGDSFVRKFNNQWHMWYIFGKKWMPATNEEPEARVYKVGHATSLDGVDWIKEEGKNIIENNIGEDECQALPTVEKVKDGYLMSFCYRYPTDFRNNPQRGYKLGFATSNDLITWKRNDNLLGLESNVTDWDSDMKCYPHLCKINNKIYLLYNGNSFGKYGFGLAELHY